MTGKNYLEQASILQTKYNDIFEESRGSLFSFLIASYVKSLPLSPNTELCAPNTRNMRFHKPWLRLGDAN